ncbi:unnamed protein product [Brachionus calyciflorus]|uniref:Uncharacterized protein n=1 Tax=Brachionus calyciflorus TaxID=104777 RepID=A0A814I4V1_9BILA|nr:unnamed protein product [Brachionus calyciflorus]
MTTPGAEGEKVELKKSIGLFGGVSLIIGVIVGSGIFVSPKGVTQEVGSVGLSLIIWVICGILSIFGAQTYAELGCMIPKAGGDYEYIMAAFGSLYGFLFVWSQLIIIIPTANAVAALTFADYLLQPIFPDCEAPQISRILIAASAVLILTWLNCVSVKWVNRIQNIFSAGKIIALLTIISFGAYCLIRGRVENFVSPFENSNYEPGKIAVAFYSGLFCYAGWSYLNFVVEEVKEPTKTLPRSIWIGLIIVIVVYTFTNVAYFTLLTPSKMLASNAVAVTFSEELIGSYSWIISIFVALSTFGFVNGILFSTSRIIFGAARNNHMPSMLAFINIKYFTPMVAVMFMSFATLICCVFQDTFVLMNMGVLAEYLFIALSVGGLLRLRKTQPDLPRPIKVNLFYPITFLIVCIFIILMTLYQLPIESFLCLGIIGAGIPVFLIGCKWEKPKSIQGKLDAMTIFVQKLTNSVFDESKLE